MPWPMVHFAISDNLCSGHPKPSLLLGSIAPDAIHMRGSITREEKGATHLVQNDKLPAKELIMIKFNEYLLQRSEREWKEFIIGYFTHIYTDLRWTDTLYADFERDYRGNQIRGVYNQEVSQVEFNIQRSMKNYKDLMRMLLKAKGYTIHPYVTQLEMSQYRDLKVEWLQDPHNEPHIKPIYFKNHIVNHFINETSKEIKDLLKDYDLEHFKVGRNIS